LVRRFGEFADAEEEVSGFVVLLLKWEEVRVRLLKGNTELRWKLRWGTQ